MEYLDAGEDALNDQFNEQVECSSINYKDNYGTIHIKFKARVLVLVAIKYFASAF